MYGTFPCTKTKTTVQICINVTRCRNSIVYIPAVRQDEMRNCTSAVYRTCRNDLRSHMHIRPLFEHNRLWQREVQSRFPPWWHSKLPAGYYYIGNYGYRGNWFRLYRQRVGGGFWDYHTQIPEESCRGGFALHPGSYSKGCITVKDSDCYDRLKNVINGYPAIWFSVYECSWCTWGYCYGGISTTSALCTTDLQVY